MVRLLHTLGSFVLFYSLVVALPKSEVSNQRNLDPSKHEAPFLITNNIPGTSNENTHIKNGRTISQTAWSIEDTEFSQEETEARRSSETHDISQGSWTFLNLFRSVLNFVNKLRGKSSLPSTNNIEHDSVFNFNEKNNEGTYLQAFKNWLSKSKVFNVEDLALSSSRESNLIPNDLGKNNYQSEREEKSHKTRGSRENEKQYLNDSKDSDVVESNGKKKQRQERKKPEISTSKNLDTSSKEVLSSYDEDSDSSEMFINEEYDETNDTKIKQENKSVRFDTDDSCQNASRDIKESSKPKLDEFNSNQFEEINKSDENHPIQKTNPGTKTTSPSTFHSQTETKAVDIVNSLMPKTDATSKSSKEDTQYIEIQKTADGTNKFNQFTNNENSSDDQRAVKFSEQLHSNQHRTRTTPKVILPEKLKAAEEYISITVPPHLHSPEFKSKYEPKKHLKNPQKLKSVLNLTTTSSTFLSPTEENSNHDDAPFESLLTEDLVSTLTPLDDTSTQIHSVNKQSKNQNNSEKATTHSQIALPSNTSLFKAHDENITERSHVDSQETKTTSPIDSQSQEQGKVNQDENGNSQAINSISQIKPKTEVPLDQVHSKNTQKEVQNDFGESKSISQITTAITNSPFLSRVKNTQENISINSQSTKPISQNKSLSHSSTPETHSEKTQKENPMHLNVTDSSSQIHAPTNISSIQIKSKNIQRKVPKYDQISESVQQTDLLENIFSSTSGVPDIEEESSNDLKQRESNSRSHIYIPQTQNKILQIEKQSKFKDLNSESTFESTALNMKHSPPLASNVENSKATSFDSDDIEVNQDRKSKLSQSNASKNDVKVDTRDSNQVLQTTGGNKRKIGKQLYKKKTIETSEDTEINRYDTNGYGDVILSNELLKDTASHSSEMVAHESDIRENNHFEYPSGEKSGMKKVKGQTKDVKRFDTFLRYLYKHSNSSYFQELQKL